MLDRKVCSNCLECVYACSPKSVDAAMDHMTVDEVLEVVTQNAAL